MAKVSSQLVNDFSLTFIHDLFSANVFSPQFSLYIFFLLWSEHWQNMISKKAVAASVLVSTVCIVRLTWNEGKLQKKKNEAENFQVILFRDEKKKTQRKSERGKRKVYMKWIGWDHNPKRSIGTNNGRTKQRSHCIITMSSFIAATVWSRSWCRLGGRFHEPTPCRFAECLAISTMEIHDDYGKNESEKRERDSESSV